MAFSDDLKSFLENRLLAWNSTLDLSSGSPAQAQVITPILQRFAEDPFSTDVPTFIVDRVTQEFPNLATDDGGALEDVLIKPLQLLLEPFKREIELVKINQSAKNASLLSDGEADAFASNWFETRDEGDYATGLVRLYYAQPTLSRVSTDKRLYTNTGLAYFPVQNYLITAQQMLFNRQGSFYYLDIVVRAESPGSEYNVDKNAISGIDQVPGIVQVANLAPVGTGRPRENNQEFLDRVNQALSEKSLVTKRGSSVRTQDLFSSVRALQVIGAGESGMNRDVLTGTGEGFLHLSGTAVIYGDWLWVASVVYRDPGPSGSILVQPGDTVRFQDNQGVQSAQVTTVLAASAGRYLLLLDRSLYASGVVKQGSFSLLKPGYLTISGIPGGMATNITVPDNKVHLGGHTDIYIRPTEDVEIQGSLDNVADEAPIIAVVDLTIPEASSNRAYSPTTDFVLAGVVDGDTLVIETGTGFAGTYRVVEVSASAPHYLRLDSIFATATAVSVKLRARVVRNIRVDLIEPHIPKLPFNTGAISDLKTGVGETTFTFINTDVQDFGVKEGDTIRILEGVDAGEFSILSVASKTVTVDRPATATGSFLSYQIYTRLTGLSRPLVRVKSLEILDSTGQGTGIVIPYGDAVDVRPVGTLEGAGRELITYDTQLVVFPDMIEWANGGLTPDPVLPGAIDDTTDARYTLGLEEPDGVVRKITHHASNQVETTEVNVPPFLWNGRRDKLLALVAHRDNKFSSAVPGAHRTSYLADAAVGNSLTIYDGPNQGNYLITDLRVLELWGKADQGHRSVAIVQVDPPLKVDPLRTAINFINDVSVAPDWTADELFGFLEYAADWDNGAGFYPTFITKLRTCLSSLGIAFSSDGELKTFFDALIRTSYSVGPSAKGDFRLYFLDPVSVEFHSKEDPTTFALATDGSKKFRIDPKLPAAQIIPESFAQTHPALWNRDLGLRNQQDRFVAMTSGSSFAKKGIRVGDTLEYYPALLDLPARGDMASSWLCLTQTGSSIVQLLIPPSDGTSYPGYGGADNFTSLAGGQLFYIDSGPDLGVYTIIQVTQQDWVANPPLLRIQLDRTMTHTTEVLPVLSGSVPPPVIDFSSYTSAFVRTDAGWGPGNTGLVLGKRVRFQTSLDNGVTWISDVEHTFSITHTVSGYYPDLDHVAADLNANVLFSAHYLAVAVDSADLVKARLYVSSKETGPLKRIKVAAPSVDSAYGGGIRFTVGDVGISARGALVLPGTKKLFGSGLSGAKATDWITIYAAQSPALLAALVPNDATYLGTYRILSVGTDPHFTLATDYFVELERSADFPEDLVFVRWVLHAVPSTEPLPTSDGGTEISDQFARFRLYDSISKTLKVTSFPWSPDESHPLLDTSEKQMELEAPGVVDTGNGQRNFAHKCPYRILRSGVTRISSTAMSSNRDGALYYVDLPVVGYGPSAAMNVGFSDGFVLSGYRKIGGYTLEVADENFVFSNKEQVDIILPNAVLPVGSTADLENEFSLAGQNLQVTYNYAPLVDDVQSFFDSPLDRVTNANMLVRHFLPGYVMLDASYSGGSAEAEVASAIIQYLNNIDPNVAEIRSDLVQDKIKNLGALKVNLPIFLIALFHGTDRRIRGMRSETAIGLSSGTPLFKGNYLQAYFIAGPNTSKKLVRPSGEQIYLTRT
jgi:hypothetical protein